MEQRDADIIYGNPIEWEMFRDRTVMVTGATGRLGMYFVEMLLKADIDMNLNLRVIAVARNEKKLHGVFGASLELPNVTTLISDINATITYEGDTDIIIHTAGAASPADFTEAPADTLWGHVNGTRNVLEYARERGVSKVLYVSTVEIYGDWQFEEYIKEDDMGIMRHANSRACYPEAKRLCETMLATYEAQYDLKYTVVRLCHTLGPGISLNDGRAFAEFIRDVIGGKDIVLHSDGSAERTYTYVADAIGAAFIALTRGHEHYYNVANTDNIISIRDLAELIASLPGDGRSTVRFENEASKLKYLPFHLGIMNTDRIMALGWRPRVDIGRTFKWTYESFLQESGRWT